MAVVAVAISSIFQASGKMFVEKEKGQPASQVIFFQAPFLEILDNTHWSEFNFTRSASYT